MSNYISQTKTRITAGLLVSALICTTAFAANANEPNVFNADTSHPDLAAAISAFEDTCMPFVLHETEMDREHDKLHMTKLMQSRGFAFRSLELKAKRVVVEPGREEWRPATQAINPNGITIVNQTGEIDMRALIPANYKTVTTQHLKYGLRHDPRLTANINWNYASQNHPGKSCSINLATTETSLAKFATDFIAKDTDWIASADTPTTEPVNWSQCVEDGADDFEFKASYEDGTIKLTMKRSDFYEPELCGKTPH